MHRDKKQQLIENTIYATLWLLVLLVIIFLSQRNNEIQWLKVYHDTIAILPFFLIFACNNIWLTTKLLFKKRYIWYFGVTTILIVFVSHPNITLYLHDTLTIPDDTLNPGTALPHPQSELSPSMAPPRGTKLEQLRPGMEPQARGQLIKYMNNILLSTLVIGFNIAIKQTGRLIGEERMKYQLSEEKLNAELTFLKHQISPHFLMNTLNNIHALVELEPLSAQSAIVKLSHMLRYLLYEKEHKKTSLAKEIEFIKSYTHLMQMRYGELLTVDLSFPKKTPALSIPPFIFITILENAFKHGTSHKHKRFIRLNMRIEGKYLVFLCTNSKNTTIPKTESSGIGLANTRKRLNLYYGDNYVWNIEETDDEYRSMIKLPIDEH